MAALTQSKESRRSKRLDVIWKGTITWGMGHPAIICIIKDISPNGAQLMVEDSRQVPDKFLLKVCNSAKSYRCQSVWRDSQTLGVRFTGTFPRWNQG